MAFVLVATFIFFAIVVLFYFSVSSTSLRGDVEDLRAQEVRETVRKITGTPEFTWSIYDCAACIDMDKVFALKNKTSYEGFWRGIPFLQISRVHPKHEIEECVKGVYPDCNTITLVDENTDLITHASFVSLCRYDSQIDFFKCELGQIVMGFETVS